MSFSIAKSIAETYDVNINGLAGSFVVKEAVITPLLEPSEEPLPTQPVKVINWWLIGAIIAAIVVISIVTWRLVIRVRAY